MTDSPIAKLDRIRRAAAANRALPPEDSTALASAIEVAERDGISIDAALGLAPGWQRAARLRRRDEALRDLARTMAGGNRAIAARIHRMLVRYAATGYRTDKHEHGTLPGGERARLLDILEADGGAVLGFERIRNIIGDSDLAG